MRLVRRPETYNRRKPIFWVYIEAQRRQVEAKIGVHASVTRSRGLSNARAKQR